MKKLDIREISMGGGTEIVSPFQIFKTLNTI